MARVVKAEVRELLAKLCGMLGSDFDGERAAAALKATDVLRRAGLTWDDVLAPAPSSPETDGGEEPEQKAPADRRRGRPLRDWRADLACCERHRELLSEHDAHYVLQLRAILLAGRTSLRASDYERLSGMARRIRTRRSAQAWMRAAA